MKARTRGTGNMRTRAKLASVGAALLTVAAIGALALVLQLTSSRNDAQADSPHAGLNFALGIDVNGDGINDCGTGVPSAVGDGAPDAVPVNVSNLTCNATLGATLNINVYLMAAGGIAYDGQLSLVYFTGITSNGPGTAVWTGCVFAAAAPANPLFVAVGCGIGVSAPPLTNLGLMSKFVFTCAASGATNLGYAVAETSLTDDFAEDHQEAGPDALTINCLAPTATPTMTPTNTLTPTKTFTPLPLTSTPSITPTPSNTPTATPLPSDKPDMTVTKTDSPDPVAAGGVISYSLIGKNIGQETATTITVADILPAEVVFLSANSSGATCSHDGSLTGGLVSCVVTGSLAQDQQVKIIIQVTAPTPVVDERIKNQAGILAKNEPFFNFGNNSVFEDTVVLSPRPDLLLTKVDEADPLVSGASETYDLTVDNLGPEPAQNVVIIDNLPAGAVYNDGASSPECDAGVGAPDPDVGQIDVICNLGTVPGQKIVQIAMTGPVVTRDSIISNRAYVSSSNELFSQTGNNLDGEFTAVLAPPPDITVDKVGPVHVKRVQKFSYTLTITNIGPGDAFNVQVSDTLPTTVINAITQRMTLQSVVGAATCSPLVSQTFTCNVAEIDANGGQVVLTVNVRAPTTLTEIKLINQSSVSDPDEPGEPTGNNSDSASTQIRACFDVTGDNFLRIGDILAEVNRFAAEPPSPSYELLYDFDGNSKITIGDILYAVNHFLDDAPCIK